MILKSEITTKARQWGVSGPTVDKDWVLGHFLSAFLAIPEHQDTIVFKGGTCLRKCYFADYRFSEDLDFTCLDQTYVLTDEKLARCISLCEEHAGILFHVDELAPLLSKNRPMGFRAVIRFWGADHPRNTPAPPPMRWTTRIKLEITSHEHLVFKAVSRNIAHDYTDTLFKTDSIPCYDLREIMSEKIRSLVQRSYTAPRDYYDIYRLHSEFNEDEWTDIIQAFFRKLQFKGITYEGVHQLINERSIEKVNRTWRQSLQYQLKKTDLPDPDHVIQSLKELLSNKFKQGS